jgi:hypothetical protein
MNVNESNLLIKMRLSANEYRVEAETAAFTKPLSFIRSGI